MRRLEERRARAVEMRRILPESVLEEVGKLDPGAIAQVREEAWPDVRDADELHDVLHTLMALPVWGQPPPAVQFSEAEQVFANQPELVLSPRSDSSKDSRASLDRTAGGGCPHVSCAIEWQGYFERLLDQGRAVRAEHAGTNYWIAAERAQTFSLLFPGAKFDRAVAEIQTTLPSSDDALLALVTGWMSHLGPATASQLGNCLGFRLPRSKRLCFAWKPAALYCEDNSPTKPRGRGRPRRIQQSLNTSGASGDCWRDSPADRGHAAQAD